MVGPLDIFASTVFGMSSLRNLVVTVSSRRDLTDSESGLVFVVFCFGFLNLGTSRDGNWAWYGMWILGGKDQVLFPCLDL